MSLDVYLKLPGAPPAEPQERIFIRDRGQTKEISRGEWDQRNPGIEPCTVKTAHEYVYSSNITHNLGRMAEAAGLYKACWRPEELGIKTSRQLIPSLLQGLEKLRDDPDWFKTYNPENRWGTYELFVAWVEEYLKACQKWPDAEVSVSR